MDAFQIVKESDSSQLWHHVESKFQKWTAIVVPSDMQTDECQYYYNKLFALNYY